MSNRRSSLAIFFGIAMLPFAIQKTRETLSPYLSNVPLLKIHKSPTLVQSVDFTDSSGLQLDLSVFKGKHVLVNVWATWCPPCRKEMPALDRLQAKLGLGADPQIVAISVDAVSFDQLRAFYLANDINNLAIYRGDERDILEALKVGGLPTTLLIDHNGQEVGRLIGPTVWDAPEIVAQLSSLVTGSTGVS